MTEAKRLWGRASWEDGAKHAVPQLVFGELAKLAIPHLERYQSDLYHDALWLQIWLPDAFGGREVESFEFTYAVCDYGTSIGTDPEYTRLRVSGGGTQWRIVVSNRDGTWYFHAEEIDHA